jgi:hypothetical protein
MQPENQKPDYGFIVNEPQAEKKGLFAGASKQKKLMLIAGGGFFIILLVLIVVLIFGNRDTNTDRLVRVAQSQQELIRIATIGEKQANSSEVKDIALTARVSVQGSLNQTQQLIAARDLKLSKAQLDGAKNTATDTKLTTARQNNQFDEVFKQHYLQQITSYQRLLSSTYDATKSNQERQVLDKAYRDIEIIRKRLD